MGYLPEVSVWDAMHSSLSAGSFSGLQSGLNLNMTRFCGKSGEADIGYCDRSVIDTPIDFLLNVWVKNSKFLNTPLVNHLKLQLDTTQTHRPATQLGHNCDPADCPVTTEGVPEPRAPALVRPPAAGGARAAPQPHPEAGPGLAPRQAGGRPQTLLQVHHVQRQLVRSTGGKWSSEVNIEEEFCLVLQ